MKDKPLTPKEKAEIDALSYEQLLREWRFAPLGDIRFQGASGAYWRERMDEIRSRPGGNEEHVRASKTVGWK